MKELAASGKRHATAGAPRLAAAGLAGMLIAGAGCGAAPSPPAPQPPQRGFGEPLRGAPLATAPTPRWSPEVRQSGPAEPATAEGGPETPLPWSVATDAVEVAVARLRAELTGQGLEAFDDLAKAPPRVCCQTLTVHGATALAHPELPGAVRVVVVWSAQPRWQGLPQQGTTAVIVTHQRGGWRVVPAWEAES